MEGVSQSCVKTTVMLLNDCPCVAVVVIMTIITMTTTNTGHFLNSNTVSEAQKQFWSYCVLRNTVVLNQTAKPYQIKSNQTTNVYKCHYCHYCHSVNSCRHCYCETKPTQLARYSKPKLINKQSNKSTQKKEGHKSGQQQQLQTQHPHHHKCCHH